MRRDDEMPWEVEARQAVELVLENAEYDEIRGVIAINPDPDESRWTEEF